MYTGELFLGKKQSLRKHGYAYPLFRTFQTHYLESLVESEMEQKAFQTSSASLKFLNIFESEADIVYFWLIIACQRS
jgi:hypothetical protein